MGFRISLNLLLMTTGKDIILFDGICNLCNRSVQYIIRHDPDERFVFASLQSKAGQDLALKFGRQNEDSIILIRDNKSYIRSAAVLQIARFLKGKKWLYGFIIVPVFIRDGIYRIIARKRYNWFGKKNECMVPGPSLTARFLK